MVGHGQAILIIHDKRVMKYKKLYTSTPFACNKQVISVLIGCRESWHSTSTLHPLYTHVSFCCTERYMQKV